MKESPIPQITVGALRQLAERADGLRDVATVNITHETGEGSLVVLRRSDNGPLSVDLVATADSSTLAEIVSTDSAVRFKPRDGFLHLTARRDNSGPQGPIRARLPRSGRRALITVDAWFVGRSAFEKFVLPYYTRVWGIDDAVALRDYYFQTSSLLAVLHQPDSNPGVDDGMGVLFDEGTSRACSRDGFWVIGDVAVSDDDTPELTAWTPVELLMTAKTAIA